MSLPARSRDYVGPSTDTRIWNSFELRPGDVILSTTPKSGTTWSQAILMMLIAGRSVTDRAVWRDSIWLDCAFRDQPTLKANLEAQTHRRCIKSHTPFDGLPYHPEVTYLAVCRHPVDVHFSMMNHIGIMTGDFLDFLLCDGPASAFDHFLDGQATDMGTDDLTLEALLHHYRSFARWAHLPNVHLAHYAQLSDNLPAQVARYASIIGAEASASLVGAIAEAASFGSMKDLARQKLDGTDNGAFTVASSFFDSASSNKWEGRLSDEQFAAYRARITQIATPDEIRWLETGIG